MGFLDLLFPPYNYVANKSTLLFKNNIVKYWLFLKDFLILETADLICC